MCKKYSRRMWWSGDYTLLQSVALSTRGNIVVHYIISNNVSSRVLPTRPYLKWESYRTPCIPSHTLFLLYTFVLLLVCNKICHDKFPSYRLIDEKSEEKKSMINIKCGGWFFYMREKFSLGISHSHVHTRIRWTVTTPFLTGW